MAVSETILDSILTDIERYVVVDRKYEGRPARVLFSGESRAAQSGISLDDDPDLLFDYNQRLLELANAVYPKRILVIGGGAFTLPMALLTALPDAVIDVVELDGGLVHISQKYFGLTDDERLQIYIADGRDWLEKTNQQYDLIILDIFSELQTPRKFQTIEWITLLAERLNQSGVVAMNMIASYQGRNAGFIRSQVAGYSSVFARLDIYPAAHGLTSWLPQNLILVAQLKPTNDYKDYLRFKAIEVPEATSEDIIVDAP